MALNNEHKQINNHFEELIIFLNQFRTKNIDYNISTEKYKWSIPDEYLDNFYNLYSNVVSSKDQKLCLFKERSTPFFSPLNINLIFKYIFKDNVSKNIIINTILDNIIKTITCILTSVLDQNKYNFMCIVRKMIKPIINFKDDGNLIFVDNVIISFPYLVTSYEFQCKLRNFYLKFMADDIKGLQCINSCEEIYVNNTDKLEIYLYGTNECIQNPCKIYKIYGDETKNFNNLSLFDIIKLLSVRRQTFNVNFETEFEMFNDKIIANINKNKKEIICDKYIDRNYDLEIIKYYCKDSQDITICQHNCLKCLCNECKINYICSHQIYEVYCILCSPQLFCDHDDNIYFCSYCIQKCKNCITLPQYNHCHGYCKKCFIDTLPNVPIEKINNVTKEKIILNQIKLFDPNLEWIHNKLILQGSRLRPDIRLKLNNYNLIIEIDENAHRSYDKQKEIKRVKDIYYDLNCDKLVVIRFNPDAYVNEFGKFIASCWVRDLNCGKIIIGDNKDYMNRIEILKNMIFYWINTEPESRITIIELFY